MLVKKIDAFHPNGAQTVPNDLTAVTVKLAGACNCHCATKCHSATKSTLVAPEVCWTRQEAVIVDLFLQQLPNRSCHVREEDDISNKRPLNTALCTSMRRYLLATDISMTNCDLF